MLATNELLVMSTSIPAFVFSLDRFSKTLLKTPFLPSTLPFLWDDRAGRSSTDVACPFRYFLKNGRQNSGSMLKCAGAPWRQPYLLKFRHHGLCISRAENRPFAVCCAEVDYIGKLIINFTIFTVRKSACTSVLNSLLMYLRDILLDFTGLPIDAYGLHDIVTLSMAFSILGVSIPASLKSVVNSLQFPCVNLWTFLTSVNSGRFRMFSIRDLIDECWWGAISSQIRSSPFSSLPYRLEIFEYYCLVVFWKWNNFSSPYSLSLHISWCRTLLLAGSFLGWGQKKSSLVFLACRTMLNNTCILSVWHSHILLPIRDHILLSGAIVWVLFQVIDTALKLRTFQLWM